MRVRRRVRRAKNGGSAMKKSTTLTIGMDLGDKQSELCILGGNRAPRRSSIRTTPGDVRRVFSRVKGKATVIIEAGSQSPWVSRLLKELGHQVIVANPRKCPSDRPGRSQERPRRCRVARTHRASGSDAAVANPTSRCQGTRGSVAPESTRHAGSNAHQDDQHGAWHGEEHRSSPAAMQ